MLIVNRFGIPTKGIVQGPRNRRRVINQKAILKQRIRSKQEGVGSDFVTAVSGFLNR